MLNFAIDTTRQGRAKDDLIQFVADNRNKTHLESVQHGSALNK